MQSFQNIIKHRLPMKQTEIHSIWWLSLQKHFRNIDLEKMVMLKNEMCERLVQIIEANLSKYKTCDMY